MKDTLRVMRLKHLILIENKHKIMLHLKLCLNTNKKNILKKSSIEIVNCEASKTNTHRKKHSERKNQIVTAIKKYP